MTAVESAKRVFDIEIKTLQHLQKSLGDEFSQAVSVLLKCKGKVVVLGVGKSGHIGKKIAATFASTGTPAFFVHPAEAAHGDLGMITNSDVVIAISNSGKTEELLNILPALHAIGAPIVSITGVQDSRLALASNVHLWVKIDQEACPLNLAPTSSTTAALVLGDALAITLLKAKGFTEVDFARSHPGGALGRRLLTRVYDVMRSDDALPKVFEYAGLSEAIIEISKKGIGMTSIVNDNGKLVGILTDGDIRRLFAENCDIRSVLVSSVMTHNPVVVSSDFMATEALEVMQKNRVNHLLVVDNNSLVGALSLQDLVMAKIV